ncbi:MAG: hypothetical protein RhofKO_30350 [Rhodothermales bacterium]
MRKVSDVVKATLAQFLLIVFSVVLGLYLSERIEERKRVQEANRLLAVLQSELQENRRLLNYWAPYHQEISENLDSLSGDAAFLARFLDNKSVLFQDLLTRGTFMGRMPASDAWDIAKSHPLIVNIDYDKLIALSKVYNQQASTFRPGFEISEIYNSKDVNTAENARVNLELMSDRMREMVAREDQLRVYYSEAGDVLGLDEEP